jgi:glycosyltransferase involved in cell wall biosynthesis
LHIGVFAATPPPHHGSTYAVELLLESRLARVHRLTHINTRYASSVADTGRPAPRKAVRFVQYLAQLLRCHRRDPFDYIIVTPAFTLWPCIRDMLAVLVISATIGAPIVAWSHSNDARAFYHRAHRTVQWLMRVALGRLAYVVTTSDLLRYNFGDFLPADRIGAIPNGLPLCEITAPRRVDGSVRVVYLSNMLQAKGWPELLAAASLACRERPGLFVTFYGATAADSPREVIDRAFAQTPFTDRVRYQGPIGGRDKDTVLETADILCLPSYYGPEALPIAILEAMRAGMAVVATPVGAIPDLVVHGEGGILVPPRDVEGLASALTRLADDHDTRQRMGRFNRRRFADRFAIDRVADLWIDLFRMLEERTT